MLDKNKIDVLSEISAQMKQALSLSKEHSVSLGADASLEQMRAAYEAERRFWNEGGAEMAKSREASFEFDGKRLGLRLHYPSDTPCGAIFFIHGGGWVLGSLDTHDRMARTLAKHANAVTIAVDYSLAPETKYPTQINECVAAARHVIAHADSFDLSDDKFALFGDSAGANLCLASQLMLRQNEPELADKFKALLLFYGIYGLKGSVSQSLLGGEWDGLSAADIEYYYDMYLSFPKERSDSLVNIFNADLSGLPASFIASCEFDPLKDDSRLLFEILKRRGRSEYREYKGVLHAFLHYTKTLDTANEALKDAGEFVRAAFI
ncbi:alpha/beta hydrolase fold domain-containing protein [Campylobacter sp. 19-13652]|uniref:alpha/beta hydrolase fold domain-containing protein n=1 Tax=Campylobacter sp. 19-13652 TaxID=2840180 RepID=UPI001C748BF9|nr:alpha/beta hydrolase fold domain-containing protein [Campylobacter sp. 19-13652]BCX80159.1 acetyl esterase [Campylobacter sp. 19-13652]